MKKTILSVALLFAALTSVSLSSCVDKEAAGDKNKTTKKETVTKGGNENASTGSLNVRYVDEEKLLEEYNLAKDVKEAMTRAQSKFVSAQQSRVNEIQQLGNQIEQKMKSNGFSSEAEYNAAVAQFQKKQQDAELYVGNLQRSTELDINQLQTQLQDSIKSYVKVFSEKNGYDAVLLQSAGLYFNPSLDVTKEVVEGLNARYVKVAKK